MIEDLQEELKKENSPFEEGLRKSCLQLLEKSKSAMGRYYGTWDEADRLYRTRTILDEQDRKSAQRREPTKILLPFVRAQVTTWVAFGFLQLTQRDKFYELQGSGPEDQLQGARTNPVNGQIELQSYSPERDAEQVLARETSRNKWKAFLQQTLLDAGRFGLTCAKTCWEEKTAKEPGTTTMAPGITAAGEPVGAEEVETPAVERVVCQGNRTTAISPYRFYPDTDYPLVDFQKGEFCASEDIFSYVRLKEKQASGEVQGLDYIKPLSQMMQHMCYTNSRFAAVVGGNPAIKADPRYNQVGDKKSGPVVITEMERWIVPKDLKIDDKHPFGTDEAPKLFIIWIANWSRIIKIQPADYDHNEFNYACGQFTEDQLELLNEGMAEMIGPLQEVGTWLFNSHIKNVKQQLYGGLLAVDQSKVEVSDLNARNPIIRLKPNALVNGLDSAIKQIPITDSTANHINDANTVWSFIQIMTGASENAMGQYSQGRRDATQSRAVNQGSAARLKTVIQVLWDTFYEPIGKQMLFNAQQTYTIETFRKVVGADATEERFAAFNKRAEGLTYDNYDFSIFDGTLPTEKGYIAQSLQELFSGMLENPMGVQMLSQPGPLRTLLVEIAELRNIRNPERFLPPLMPPNATPMQQPTSQPPAESGGPTPQGQGAAGVY